MKPTDQQNGEINTLIRLLEGLDPGTDWPARCVEIIGTSRKLMTKTTAGQLIRQLEQHAEELMREPEPEAAGAA